MVLFVRLFVIIAHCGNIGFLHPGKSWNLVIFRLKRVLKNCAKLCGNPLYKSSAVFKLLTP